jgi:hypothetical protein
VHGGKEDDVRKLELASCNESAVGPDHEAAMICSYGFGTSDHEGSSYTVSALVDGPVPEQLANYEQAPKGIQE